MEKLNKRFCKMCGKIEVFGKEKFCFDCRKKKYRAYQKSYHKNYLKNSENYKKHQVRLKTNSAILGGHLAKEEKCCACGASEHLEAHHSDYNSPQDFYFILTLCKNCHTSLHVNLKTKAV